MQGPYATDPGEEIARLHRVVIRAERLGHQGNILELSLSIHQHEKGQMQYNQIKEVNKATHVNGGGGETQNTFPLYFLGKKKVFKTS